MIFLHANSKFFNDLVDILYNLLAIWVAYCTWLSFNDMKMPSSLLQSDSTLSERTQVMKVLWSLFTASSLATIQGQSFYLITFIFFVSERCRWSFFLHGNLKSREVTKHLRLIIYGIYSGWGQHSEFRRTVFLLIHLF